MATWKKSIAVENFKNCPGKNRCFSRSLVSYVPFPVTPRRPQKVCTMRRKKHHEWYDTRSGAGVSLTAASTAFSRLERQSPRSKRRTAERAAPACVSRNQNLTRCLQYLVFCRTGATGLDAICTERACLRSTCPAVLLWRQAYLNRRVSTLRNDLKPPHRCCSGGVIGVAGPTLKPTYSWRGERLVRMGIIRRLLLPPQR